MRHVDSPFIGSVTPEDKRLVIPDPRFEMPELLIPGQKPVGPVEIDWTNPLTKDLTCHALPTRAGDFWDTTGRYLFEDRSGVETGSSEAGFYIKETTTNSPTPVTTETLPGPTVAARQFTMAAQVRVRDSSAGLNFCSFGTVLFDMDGATPPVFRVSMGGIHPTGYEVIEGEVAILFFTRNVSGTVCKAYVNGVLLDTRTKYITWADSQFLILSSNIEYGWNGAGDRFDFYWGAVWHRELSELEVASLTEDPYQFLVPA